MKIYSIIGGVNGVGKSSFTGVLKGRTTDLGTFVDVYKITANLGGNALEGGKVSVRLMDDCLKKGVSFTQETTLSGHKTEITARKAREAGYYVRLYYIGLDTAARAGSENCINSYMNKRGAGRFSPLQNFFIPDNVLAHKRACINSLLYFKNIRSSLP